MRNLEKRLEKLEQEYKPVEVIVFLVTSFGEGELKGWQGNSFYIARNPEETEEECKHRAYQEAKAHGQAHPSLLLPGGVLMLHMDREPVPYVKPERTPKHAATVQPQQPTVEPGQPLSSPPSKPQPPRIVTIKEVEGQHADRRHWMG